MNIRTRLDRYRQLDDRRGLCSTRTWMLRLEWTRGVKAAYDRGGKEREAIERLFEEHRRRLPSSMIAGWEYVSSLESPDLFPDTIYLFTACGSNPSWRRKNPGSARLFSLIGYPNSF